MRMESLCVELIIAVEELTIKAPLVRGAIDADFMAGKWLVVKE